MCLIELLHEIDVLSVVLKDHHVFCIETFLKRVSLENRLELM